MIILKGITKRYGDTVAMQDVNLIIPNESICGIIGRSSGGKSALLSIMSLLEPPDAGEVYYGDERVDTLQGEALRLKRQKIGMIFQNGSLFGSRTAAGNIGYPLEIAGKTKKERTRRIDELLELVHLRDKRNAWVAELSSGEKQRVAIARALAGAPEILFCDEITSLLDPLTARSILRLIRDIHDRFKLTVVLGTHQMSVIRSICDGVMVFDEGRIVEGGTVQTVFTAPKTETAQELVYA